MQSHTASCILTGDAVLKEKRENHSDDVESASCSTYGGNVIIVIICQWRIDLGCDDCTSASLTGMREAAVQISVGFGHMSRDC